MADNMYLVCLYSVRINGQELDDERRQCVTDIDIKEQSDGSNTCTLTLEDPNFVYIGDNIFIEEATISVNIYWDMDSYSVSFSGYISAIDISFPQSGSPVLSIYCLDETHLMNRKKKKRSWDNVTSADVVKKIAQEYGYKTKIESGYTFKKEDTISQSNTTDIEFLESLAGKERDQFMCKLMGDTIQYVRKGVLQTPVATVSYRTGDYDIISFSPKINKETRQEEVEVADITAGDKKVDKGVASDSSTSRDTQGESVKTSSSPTGTSANSSNAKALLKYDTATQTWK